MDVETSEAIDRVGNRLDTLERRIDQFEQSVSERFDTLGQRVDRLEHSLRAEIAESRRHSDIQFESLKDNIHILADGFAGLSSKIDRLRPQ